MNKLMEFTHQQDLLKTMILHGQYLNNLYFSSCNFHYISIPKVANTSIKICIAFSLNLLTNSDKLKIQQQPNLIHKLNTKKVNLSNFDQEFYEFTLLRDPIERFISFYKDKILGNGWTDTIRERYMKIYGLNPNQDIDNHIKVICDIPDDHSEIHFRSQSQIIKQSKLSKNLKIFSYNNFQLFKDYLAKSIKKKFNKEIYPLGHFQRSKQSTPISLSSVSINRLRSRYKNDYELIEHTYIN